MPAKKVHVTRAFMLKVADSIYNTKTRQFLRLCNGTLQNGPDPEDAERPMHCGLGELYFAMTGRQPKEDHMTEEGVIDTAVELSDFGGVREAAVAKAIAGVKALKLPGDLQSDMIDNIEQADEEDDESPFRPEAENEFRSLLNDIPEKNDEDTGHCSVMSDQSWENYRNRASRVATQIRRAAKKLPS